MNRLRVLLILVLVAYLNSCTPDSGIPKNRTLKNGYILPKATEDNVNKLLKMTLDNLIYVKGGSFMMGDSGYIKDGQRVYTEFWADAFPVHKVTLDSYSISKFEVTYWEYDIYTDLTRQKPTDLEVQHQQFRKERFPVGLSSWQDANAYCLWLGEITNLPFALPTEAQWEYAARSRGKNVGYATDNGKIERGRNYVEYVRGDKIREVGLFPSNPLGLFDMSGNAMEWVNDWYDENYYKISPELNPKGPDNGIKKVLRGGAAHYDPEGNNVYGRMARRIVSKENKTPKKYAMTGFRCVVNYPDPIKSVPKK